MGTGEAVRKGHLMRAGHSQEEKENTRLEIKGEHVVVTNVLRLTKSGTVSFTWTHLRFLEERNLGLCLWLLRVVISGEKGRRVEETLSGLDHCRAYMQLNIKYYNH